MSATAAPALASRVTRGGWLLVAVLVLIADQASKLLVRSVFTEHQMLPVLAFLDLTLTYNRGAAFSFLSDAGGWQRWFFTTLAVLVSGVITVWLCRLRARQRLLGAGLALILGGAVGNLVDRVLIGAVVDFIYLNWRGFDWPAFNIADSAITVGAVLFAIHTLMEDDTRAGRGEASG